MRPIANAESGPKHEVAGAGLATAALAVPLAIQAVSICLLPLERLIQVIPDDAFYYLILARNRAESGAWSFDHQAPATGFHLAYAYLLLALDKAMPGLSFAQLAAIIVWSASAVVLAAFGMLLACVKGRARLAVLAGLALVVAAPAGRIQCALMMETPLVIAAAALLFAIVAGYTEAGGTVLIAAAAVGLFGSLARSDFGILPAALLAAALIYRREDRAAVRIAAAALGGGIAGVVLVTAHTYLVSGAWLQASVMIKRHWGALYGYDPWPATLLLAQLWDPRNPSPLIFCVVAAVSIAAVIRVRRMPAAPRPRLIATAALLFIPAAILFYGFDPIGVQIWYLAPFLVPLAMVAAAVIAWLPPPRLRVAAGAAILSAFASSLMAPPMLWPSQVSSMAGGQLLRDRPEAAPVGGWNSGIASWFSGRDLVNLDGLVNDEVYPYAATGTLDAYVDKRGLGYVLDYPSTLRMPGFEQLLGMPCGRVTRRLLPVASVGTAPEFWWKGAPMTLYQVLPAPPVYLPNQPIDFAANGDAGSYEGCGWAYPDSGGSRIETTPATLILSLAPGSTGPLAVEVMATAAAAASLALSVGDQPAAQWELQPGENRLLAQITIPSSPATLTFSPTNGAAVEISRVTLSQP